MLYTCIQRFDVTVTVQTFLGTNMASQTCLAAPKQRSPPSSPCEPRTRESAASSFPLLSASSTCSSTALSRAGDWEAEVSAARAGGTRSLPLPAARCSWAKPKKQQGGGPPSLVLMLPDPWTATSRERWKANKQSNTTRHRAQDDFIRSVEGDHRGCSKA